MDTTRTLLCITELHREQMRGLRHIAGQNARMIEIMEKRRTDRLSAFLSKTWKSYSDHMATNLGKWLAGFPLWLLALELLGLRPLLEKLLVFYG